MNLLLKNRYVAWALLDLQIAVVGLRKHGRSLRHEDTTLAQRPALRAIKLSGAAALPRLRPLSRSFQRLRRERRNSSVRRIHNQRGSMIQSVLRLRLIQPELQEVIVRYGPAENLHALGLLRLLFDFG